MLEQAVVHWNNHIRTDLHGKLYGFTIVHISGNPLPGSDKITAVNGKHRNVDMLIAQPCDKLWKADRVSCMI
ncbi:hypothetical protein D3C71_2035840 [compost metagenome]